MQLQLYRSQIIYKKSFAGPNVSSIAVATLNGTIEFYICANSLG